VKSALVGPFSRRTGTAALLPEGAVSRTVVGWQQLLQVVADYNRLSLALCNPLVAQVAGERHARNILD
jgi:hypothetical protein